MMKSRRAGIRALSTVGLMLLATVAVGFADVSDVVLAIHATNGRSEGVLEITAQEGTWDGENFFWSTDQAIPIMSGSELIGSFGPGRLAIFADPQISMGFSVQAADLDTTFTLTSALNSFPTMPDGQARADAAFTVMDFFGTGTTLTGAEPGGGAYRAFYNGGTTFVEALPSIVVVPPDPLAVGAFESPGGGLFTSIGPVSSMQAEISFILSANGFASGSSNFVIVPEPAGLLVLLAGLGLLRRR